jgi:hypothetical protein
MELTAEQAETLLVHHLHVAALLFEAAHDDRGASIKRQLQEEVRSGSMPQHFDNAASAFVDVLLGWYEGQSMDAEGGDNDA